MKKQFDIKKLVLLNLPYLLMGLFATNFGEAWRLAQGANASEKFLSLFAVLPGALQSFWPSLHPLDLLVGLCCGAGLRLAVYLKSKNAKKYRHGMEYGSAHWGTREDIAPYIDPVFQNNVILTKTESLTTGVIQLDKKPGRLFDTVAQAMSGIVYAAEKKEIAVSVDCPEDLTVSHDSKWTSEALFNLLDNAVKYTPAGGKIAVSVVLWEMYVEIKVTDTGKGISESNQAAIFRRFYREEEVHEQQGVGIGLYLAREIVTRQGGYIKVVSEPGKGSEFSIMLPTK